MYATERGLRASAALSQGSEDKKESVSSHSLFAAAAGARFTPTPSTIKILVNTIGAVLAKAIQSSAVQSPIFT